MPDPTEAAPAPTAPAEGPLLRANFLLPIVGELERKGHSADDLLQKHLSPAWKFHNGAQLAPLRNYLAFFEEAAERAEDPFLGLRLGGRFKPENFGPIGVIFRASPNLRAALSRLVIFLNSQRGGTRVELLVDGPVAEWRYRIEDETLRPRRQEVEFSLAATTSFMRAMLGPGWAPIEVHFEHSAPTGSPAERQILHNIFQSRILFDQPDNKLIFRSRDLNRRDLSAPAAPAPRLERDFRERIAEAEAEDSLANHVRRTIAQRLGHAPVQLADLAGELGLSARTLQRRLTEEGVSLRALVQGERRAAAEALLGAKAMRITSVAHNVGYADPAVLSRAFKAWNGVTPKRFRSARDPRGKPQS